MQVNAKLHNYRQSPRKVRLVANFVRGLDTQKALERLEFTNKRAAKQLLKLIKSAMANATHNFSLKEDNLYIKKISVDTGRTLKRWRARAFGRASMIRKRSSNIIIVLEEKVPTKPKQQKTVKKEDAIKAMKSLKEIKELTQEYDEKSEAEELEQKPKKTQPKGFMPKIFRRKSG